ncbi:MAG: hypothetical protein JWR47_1065 [Phenylobacterium sp.]|jgi:hypothetical protein|nr:hypothetical protein [Phenylobacterium sp.]
MRSQRETWKTLLWIATGLSGAVAVYLAMLVLALEKSSVLSGPVRHSYALACGLLALGCLVGPALAWRSFRRDQFKRTLAFATLPLALLAGAAMAHALNFGSSPPPLP